MKPYKVDNSGVVTVRATGQRIGYVRIIKGQWVGVWTGPNYPTDPWDQKTVSDGLAGRQWSLARLVWEEHLRRSEPTDSGHGPSQSGV